MAVSQAEYDKAKNTISKLRRDKKEAEDAEQEALEEAGIRRVDTVKRGGLRFLSESLEDAGCGIAGLLGASDWPIDGAKLSLAIGGPARIARTFVKPLGAWDQILSLPNGLWKGGLTMSAYDLRMKAKAGAGNGNG